VQISDAPLKIPEPWAKNAGASFITYPVPTPSQIGIRNGAASFNDGFPPNTFSPLDAGGAGPFGTDYNGIFKQITAGLQWIQAGGPAKYDGSYQSTIGGYMNGAVVLSAVTAGLYWRSTTDNNVTNPDAAGAGWVAQWGNGSLSSNGYWVFPFGLVVQWGALNPTGSVPRTLTFPLTFPNACFTLVLTDAGNSLQTWSVVSLSAASASVTSTSAVTSVFWIAIGH